MHDEPQTDPVAGAESMIDEVDETEGPETSDQAEQTEQTEEADPRVDALARQLEAEQLLTDDYRKALTHRAVEVDRLERRIRHLNATLTETRDDLTAANATVREITDTNAWRVREIQRLRATQDRRAVKTALRVADAGARLGSVLRGRGRG